MRLKPSIALLRTQPDERLVELARDGSEPAFAAIVERYRRQVLRACRRILPDARAEDATQQAFLSAWTALRRGDAVLDVHAWLLRIARNTALNALRVRGYDYDELQESLRVSEAPQAELERRDVVRQTLAGLAALPERQREALLRSAVEGAAHADIARDLGLSEGAARQLVLRARMTLRSAASALVPAPLITWAASAGTGAGVATGAAGSGALLAKVGAVVIVAGATVAAPVVVHHSGRHADDASAAAASRPAAAAAREAETAQDAPAAATAAELAPRVERKRSGKGTGSSRSSPSHRGRGRDGGGRDDRRGDEREREREREHEGGDDSTRGGGDDDHSGPGETETQHSDGSGSGSSGSGSSGSGDSSGSGSGSGSGDDDSSSSGSGRGDSGGSDDSTSGSSGSGSSGSGSDDAVEDPLPAPTPTPTSGDGGSQHGPDDD